MEQYEIHVADAAEHNLRMMAHGDRTLETDNLEDLRGLAREMRFRAESAQYELQAALEQITYDDKKRLIDKALNLLAEAKSHSGQAMNETEPPQFRRRALEIHELGERIDALLGEISSLAQI